MGGKFMKSFSTISFQEEGRFSRVFGLKLQSIKTKGAFHQPGLIYQDHRNATSNFINMLYDPSQDISFTMRYIISPDQQYTSLGAIDVVLLVKIRFPDESNQNEAELQECFDTIKVLLGGAFSEYVWKEISDSEELEQVINPIPWDQAHFYEIRRREENVRLDQLLPHRPIGFTKEDAPQQVQDSSDEVYFVHPYIPSEKGLSKLLTTLMNGNKKIILSTILKPTELRQEESEFLYQQIAISEGRITDSTPAVRVHPKRANTLSYAYLKNYLIYHDAPFYMTFTVASEAPIERMMLEMIGLSITEPIGQNVTPYELVDSFSFHLGGYDVVSPASNRETDVLIHNMRSLSQESWGETISPAVPQRLRFLFDGNEALTAFHFPINVEEDIPGINTHYLGQQPLPKAFMEVAKYEDDALYLGKNHYYGFEQDVVISQDSRKQHTYIIGQTGTGKTTLMKTMILSDMKAGRGVGVIDPHGELYQDLLEMIPEERKDDVVLFDPADVNYPVGFNLLEFTSNEEREAIIKEMRAILKRYIMEYFQFSSGDYAGSVFFQHMQNNMLLASSDIINPGTILEVVNIFMKKDYWRRWLPLKWQNFVLENWVESYLPNTDYFSKSRDGIIPGDYFSSKLADFTNDPRISLIFGQPFSTIRLDEIIRENKILLINLSKGLLGEANASMLGMILMAKLNTIFMERRNELLDDKALKPFYLYVDEFQNLATENFSILLSEARKFGLGLILANQFISQIQDHKIKDAIFGNVGTLISFRLGLDDASLMESQYIPHYTRQDLCNLPNFHAIIRTHIKGKRTIPSTFHTTLHSFSGTFTQPDEILAHSREKYALPIELAEFIVEGTLAMKKIHQTEFHWESSDIPEDEWLRNCDKEALFGAGILEDKPFCLDVEKICLTIQRQIIHFLLYEKGLPAGDVQSILTRMRRSDLLLLMDTAEAVKEIFRQDFSQLEHEIFGLINYYLKEALVEEFHKRQAEIEEDDDEWTWFESALRYIDSDQWTSLTDTMTADLWKIIVDLQHRITRSLPF
jgi:hypothetical protein